MVTVCDDTALLTSTSITPPPVFVTTSPPADAAASVSVAFRPDFVAGVRVAMVRLLLNRQPDLHSEYTPVGVIVCRQIDRPGAAERGPSEAGDIERAEQEQPPYALGRGLDRHQTAPGREP